MALKQSSRARLTRYTLPEFAGDSLFDSLGRVVSRSECLPRKEFYEAWAVAKRVRRRFRGGPVIELAAGHGLLSYMLLLLDSSSSHALCVDKRLPMSAERLAQALAKEWPRLAEQVTLKEGLLEEIDIPPAALVASVHACGRLSDRVLDLAISARARVALLPCCHSLKLCDTGGLEGWVEGRLAIDIQRVQRLRDAGYRVHTQTIPEQITPQNRLLLGAPLIS